jgi:hypothetical protein
LEKRSRYKKKLISIDVQEDCGTSREREAVLENGERRLTSQARGMCCSQTGHQLRSIVVVVVGLKVEVEKRGLLARERVREREREE